MTKQKQRYSLNKNKYLLDPELDRLNYIIESYYDRDLRNCLLLDLALNTGARASELLNVTFSDINEYDETLFIKGLKGSDDREIPLRPSTFRHLLRWRQEAEKLPKNQSLQHGQKRLFTITYPRLVQVWEFYRPTQKKFHSLRHTFAIRLYKKTKDIRLLQVALGHRNITNTMIYADYVYSQQELRRLIV